MFLGILGIHADSVWGGVIGGVTVCLGVVLAEYFDRKRQVTHRFDDAFILLMEQGAKVFFVQGNLPVSEIHMRCSLYRLYLANLHNRTRWPLHNAKEIRAEIEAIIERWDVSSAAWAASPGARPIIKDVIGHHIGTLIYRPRDWWVV